MSKDTDELASCLTCLILMAFAAFGLPFLIVAGIHSWRWAWKIMFKGG